MKRQDIEAIYSTTQIQQGLLFHTLYAPTSGVYINQVACTIDDLDVDAFRSAWTHVIDDNPILRTTFIWKRIEEAKQVVVRPGIVKPPLAVEDWRGLEGDELKQRKEALLSEDHRKGFDLAKAPLMRLTLCRVSDDSHWLVWTNHHLLLDGWSRQNLLRDVFEAYARLVAGVAPESTKRPPFARYVAWLEQQDIRVAERRWREVLRGYSGPPGFGVDRAVEELHGTTGSYDQRRTQVSDESRAALIAASRAYKVTLNTLFQGAWSLLLSRYSGARDVVFGAVTSGRAASIEGVERMMGLLINTLPVRVQVDPSAEVGAWLRDLQAEQASLRRFDYAPPNEVRKWSEVPKGRALYESILVFENYPIAALGDAPGMQIRDVEASERINYPLTLVVVPRSDDIRITLAYDRRRFDDETILRMERHLLELLEILASGEDLRVLDVELAENRQARAVSGPAPQTSERTVVDLVAARAECAPNSLAVVAEDDLEDWSYARLLEVSESVARALVARGVSVGDRVAAALPRGKLLPAAFVGTMRAGAVFVPMDPTWPAARQAFVIEDAGATVVLRDGPAPDGAAPSLDLRTCLSNDDGSTVLPRPPTAGDAAYIIYTSGSTGTPKGVLLRHSGLRSSARELERILMLTESSRLCQFTSVAFDGCIGDMVAAFAAGAALCLAPEEAATSAGGFRDALDRMHITAIMVPPSYLKAVEAQSLPGLKTVVAVGEPLRRDVVQMWQPGRVMLNGYGPSEMTICTTLGRCEASDDREPDLGEPVAGTTVSLFDPDLRPAIAGAAGEIYISGPGEAVGYWNRPALTAERFLPNPFGSSGGRMYRSGDIGRFSGERLEFVGRVDHQVKVRGFRVELGEVEAKLRRLEGVAEAAVVAVKTDAEPVLAAFIERTDSQDVGVLRALLARDLPAPMIPRLFQIVESWPRTSTGKIDRRALVASAGRELEPKEETSDAGQDDLLQQLREVWQRILGIREVGDDDDFFEVAGGDSLTAVRMISEVEKRFGVELPVKAVFKAPTLRTLARMISGGPDDGSPKEETWRRDLTLDDSIRPLQLAEERRPEVILLTGATGFVGSWILKDLLEAHVTRVVCLVRGDSDEAASKRLAGALRYAGADEGALDKCDVVRGDLGAPGLGWSPATRERIASTVDCIVHAGAWVDYLHPYEKLREPNVLGTIEMLKLTGEGRPKRFVHVSSLGVFPTRFRGQTILETSLPPADVNKSEILAYALTKHVSERLVWEAMGRGLAGTILRLSDVAGDTQTGRSNPRDMFFMTLMACLRVGVAPSLEFGLNAVPVDYVAHATARVALSSRAHGPCLHLCDERDLALEALVRAAEAEGHTLRRVPLSEWMALISSAAHDNDDHRRLTALWAGAKEGSPLPAWKYDTQVCRRQLEGPSPSIDEGVLRRYVRSFTPSPTSA